MGASRVGQVTPNQTYHSLPPPAQSVQSQSAQSQRRPLRMPLAQGRAFTLVQPDVDVSNAVVEGMVTIFSYYAWILFDTGSTHSFIAASFVLSLGLHVEPMNFMMSVVSPL